MMTRSQAPQKPAVPQAIGFLLLENFTLFSLASAIEPLRMANQLAGRELYRWFTLSLDGEPISASDGLKVTPDAAITVPLALDMVVVCGGVGPARAVQREHVIWLQGQARLSRRLGGICTGSWALAKAGLLDGYETSVHWECLAAMQES
ncbi:AraC family transcriptional regulator, partial [Halomonas sp.]